MIAINVQGLLYTTRAALPHLLQAAEDGPRRGARTTRKHRPSSVATGCAPLGHVCRWQQIAPDRDTWSRSWAGIQLPMELEQWDGGGEGGRQRAIGLADKEHTT